MKHDLPLWGDADTTAPALTSLKLPKTIDVTGGDKYASFTVGATDEGLGVSRVTLFLDHSYQSTYGSTSLLTFADSTDSFDDGKSSNSFLFDQTTGSGTYNVLSADVYDNAGNEHYYSADQLALLGIKTSFQVVDRNATPTATITAPTSITEGHDSDLTLSFTFLHASSASTDITISIDKAHTTTFGIDIGSYEASYAVSQSPAGDYTVELPSISIPDGAHATGGTLALTVHATGQVFDNGSDTETVLVTVYDDDQTGTKHDDHLSGSPYDDRLVGKDGNDTLDGGTGRDLLIGGRGDDTYIVDTKHDSVVEKADEGIDTVRASTSWTLEDNFENLTLTGGAKLSGTGNALANAITGNNDRNTLSGLDGDDILSGGKGDDTLVGGHGLDTLTGGKGNDLFVFDDKDTGSSKARADTITDFAAGDRIDLHLVDAVKGGSDNAFHWIGTGAFTGHAGELGFYQTGGNTYAVADVNGDGGTDLRIRLVGSHDLIATDFIL